MTEFMPAGSLWDVLHDDSVPDMPWKKRALILRQTALGMVYLHNREAQVLHRDLKSPNLLLDESLTCKVSLCFADSTARGNKRTQGTVVAISRCVTLA